MKKVIAMAVCLFAGCTALNASAADEVLAKQLVAASNFQSALRQEFETNMAGLRESDRAKFLSAFNFKKAEDVFVQSIAKNLSNDEAKALIAAYAIPGYASAVRKQTIATNALIGFVIEESKRVVPVLGEEN